MIVVVDVARSDHELVSRIRVREFGIVGELRLLVLCHGLEMLLPDLVLVRETRAENERREHRGEETAIVG